MFETILVPLDGSAHAEAALALAALIPSQRLRLLNVRSDLVQLEAICASAHEGEAYLEQLAAPLRQQGHTVETQIVFGDARRQIVALSALADLIVMGSRGCGATRTFFLGSVADWVARHAPVPTLIVRGGEEPAVTMPLTRIVVPLDGAPLAEAALPMAGRLATALDLPLHLVRVLELNIARASVEAGTAAARATAEMQAGVAGLVEEYLAEQAQRLREQNLVVTQELRRGVPATDLLAALRAGDLVVLATHDRGGLDRWLLGSTADEVVRHAPGPVMLVRAGAASQAEHSTMRASAGGS